jgi:hypothetical protein
MRSNIQL